MIYTSACAEEEVVAKEKMKTVNEQLCTICNTSLAQQSITSNLYFRYK